MRKRNTRSLLLLLSLLLPGATAGAAPPPGEAQKPPPVVQSFVAAGPSAQEDLARLRTAVTKIAGVQTVEVRPGAGGATLTVKGDVLFTLIAATARPLGYTVEPTPSRYYDASGPAGETELTGLRGALAAVPGADKVALSRLPGGAAVRVTGIAANAELRAAAKSAGFELQQLGAYAASGPTGDKKLGKLRTALSQASGVERVELHPLTGGATLLIHGDVKDAVLAKVARSAGYDLWPLHDAAKPRAEFRVAGAATPGEQEKLRQVLERLEGLAEIEIRADAQGTHLSIGGERLKPDRVAAAAAEAGFRLTMEEHVSLPNLVPQAGRNTPPDYDDAIVEDPIVPGGPAPLFSLLSQDGKSTLRLSDYVGKRPVVLLFGSCS